MRRAAAEGEIGLWAAIQAHEAAMRDFNELLDFNNSASVCVAHVQAKFRAQIHLALERVFDAQDAVCHRYRPTRTAVAAAIERFLATAR